MAKSVTWAWHVLLSARRTLRCLLLHLYMDFSRFFEAACLTLLAWLRVFVMRPVLLTTWLQKWSIRLIIMTILPTGGPLGCWCLCFGCSGAFGFKVEFASEKWVGSVKKLRRCCANNWHLDRNGNSQLLSACPGQASWDFLFFFLIPSIYLNHAPGLLMMKNWRIPVNDCLPSVEVRSGLFAAESRRHGTLWYCVNVAPSLAEWKKGQHPGLNVFAIDPHALNLQMQVDASDISWLRMRLNFPTNCPKYAQAFTARLLRKLPHRLGAQAPWHGVKKRWQRDDHVRRRLPCGENVFFDDVSSSAKLREVHRKCVITTFLIVWISAMAQSCLLGIQVSTKYHQHQMLYNPKGFLMICCMWRFWLHSPSCADNDEPSRKAWIDLVGSQIEVILWQ